MSQPSPTGRVADFRTLSLAVGLAAVGLALGYALVFAAGSILALGFGYVPGPTVGIVLSALLLQGVAFGTVAYVYTRRTNAGHRFVNFRLPSLRQLALVVGGWVVAFGLNAGVGILTKATGAPVAQNDVARTGLAHPEVLLWLVPISFLLIGPGEELLFRGVVQGTLRERFGPVPAIATASVLFGVAHGLSLSGSIEGRLVYMAAIAVIGLVLGGLYEYTDNLTVPALVHGAYDATLFALIYVLTTYGPPSGVGALAPLGHALAGLV